MALLLPARTRTMTNRCEIERTREDPRKNNDPTTELAVKDPRTRYAPGAHVVARGRTWSLVRVQEHARCCTVALAGTRRALSLIVPMSSGRLSLDRVGRHHCPSPFRRHEQISMHSQRHGRKGDISTLHSWGHFYFALTNLRPRA